VPEGFARAAYETTRTLLNIDFLAVRVKLDGLCFKFKNEDP